MLMLGVGADELEQQTGSTAEGALGVPSDADPTLVSSDPTAVNTKKRRPQVRLTAERLLSSKGLPYVAKYAPKRVRIAKSKSTYENLSNIVQFYQLWAHELFPKARFKEFVRLCNSIGKTDIEVRNYRMEIFRKDMDAQFGGGSEVNSEGLDASASSRVPVTSTQTNNENNENGDNIHSTSTPEKRPSGSRLFEEDEDDIYTETTLPSRTSTDVTNIPSHVDTTPSSDRTNTDKIASEPPSSSATAVNRDDHNMGYNENEILAMEAEMENFATEKIGQLENEDDDNENQSIDEDEDALDAMKELGF